MSKKNGDRARYQKDRARKLAHRQRIQALMTRLRNRSIDAQAPAAKAATTEESPVLP